MTFDPFDALMISRCTVLKKGVGAVDAYGLESQSLTDPTNIVESNVPCRISRGGGSEAKSGKQASVGRSTIYMRPRAYPLTEHHWILLNGAYYNILDVQNPSGMNHHLELPVELVKP